MKLFGIREWHPYSMDPIEPSFFFDSESDAFLFAKRDANARGTYDEPVRVLDQSGTTLYTVPEDADLRDAVWLRITSVDLVHSVDEARALIRSRKASGVVR